MPHEIFTGKEMDQFGGKKKEKISMSILSTMRDFQILSEVQE